MCNEFNSGKFLSYIWDLFKALHIAEKIRDWDGGGMKVNLHFYPLKS